MNKPILSLQGVVKDYQKKRAVDHVSFDVPTGSIYGLLGPNGAGKTSLIRIITTITRADEGRVLLGGEPIDARTPERIGYMPEERGLYKKMAVGEQLMYLAQLKGLSAKEARTRIRHWFDRFEIADWWDKKIQELSKGMQQKVQFIATVMHEPKLLILDEPFSGLDPVNTNLIKSEIREINKRGTSIIFSTHRMEQVEEICEYITLISNGKNILTGKLDAVKQEHKNNVYQIAYDGQLPTDLATVDAADSRWSVLESSPGSLTVRVDNDQASNEVLRYLIGQRIHIRSFHEVLPTLNEIFIKLVS